MIHFSLNGNLIQLKPSDETLLHYLRGVQCLKGTKEGCSTGHCGACTVLIDGKPRRSCLTKLSNLDGKSITTIEGLTDHTIQKAFLDTGAVQCGFCTPGMILAAKALMDVNHKPTREEIKKALEPNYCRCTGYTKIIKAVETAASRLYPQEWAAEERQELETLEMVNQDGTQADNSIFSFLGKHQEDADGWKKVCGTLLYADDIEKPGMVYGRPLFARTPKATILSMDFSEAEKVQGLIKIYTAKDVPGLNGVGMAVPDWPVMVEKDIQSYGDVLAFVVAQTPEIAQEAANLIKVELKQETPICTIQEAYEKNSIQKRIDYTYHDVDVVKKEPGLFVIKQHFSTSAIEHAYLEPESVVSYPEEDGIVVETPTQAPFEHRKQMSAVLGLPLEKVRYHVTPLGGGFGGKGDITIQPLAAIAAMDLKRPVKCTLKREESLFVSTKKHPYEMDYEVGFTKDGTLRYVDALLLSDGGAYSALTPRVIDQSCIFAVGPYRIAAGRVVGIALKTNNTPSSAMRGFGINQASFAMETIFDEVAEKLHMDPFLLREKNVFVKGDETFTGETLFESVASLEGVKICREKLNRSLEKYKGKYPHDGVYLGWGMASCFKNVGAGKGRVDNAGATIRRLADGSFHLSVSGVDMGQGFRTGMREIVAETLQIDPSKISVLNGDTRDTMLHGSAVGERQTLVAGMAVKVCADRMREKLATSKPGEELEVSYFHEAPRTFSLSDTEGRKSVPPEQYKNYPSYAYGTQAAIVEVNSNTGKVKVLEAVVVNDAGKVLNPTVLMGQLEGSVSMGIGYALSEHYTQNQGVPVTRNYGSLGVPKISSMPLYDITLIEDPEPNGPFGAKGISEIGTIPMTTAITSAIYNAVGVRITSLPVTSEKILDLLRSK